MFWIVIAAGAITGHFWETAIAFLLVFIHESGHVAAAVGCGRTVTEVELLPFGGVARMEDDHTLTFAQEALIVMAGPIQHLWLPVLSHVLIRTPFWGEAQHQLFLQQNTALLIFNLLPIWPLDGGRLLHLYFQNRYPFRIAYEKVLRASLLLLFATGALFFFIAPFSLNIWVVLSFIFLSIYKERQVLPYRLMSFLFALAASRRPQARVRHLIVPAQASVPDVLARFYKYTEHKIIVDRPSGFVIDDKKLVHTYFSGKYSVNTIDDCLNVNMNH